MTNNPDEPTALELALHERFLKLLCWTTLAPTLNQTEDGRLTLSVVFTNGRAFYMSEVDMEVGHLNGLVDHGDLVNDQVDVIVDEVINNAEDLPAQEAYELRDNWVKAIGWPEYTDGEVIAAAAQKVPGEYQDLFNALSLFVDDLKSEHFHTLSLTSPEVAVATEATRIAWELL